MNRTFRALYILLLVALCLPSRADLFTQVTPQYDPGFTANDQFGISGVKLSHDGLMVLAATPFITFPPVDNDGQGSGYLYQFTNNQWAQTGQFISTLNQTTYGIGFALSKDGSTALFGDLPDPLGTYLGEADFYAVANGNPYVVQPVFDPTNFVGTGFGSMVALSGDGKLAVIGAPSDSLNNGAAYIFTYGAGTGTWIQAAALNDPNNVTGNDFGSAVSVSADGGTVLIGTYAGGGTVYLYNLVGGTWGKIREFDNVAVCQGCMALSADGQAVVIATNNGVTVYTANDSPAWSGTPIAITDPSGPVDMSADGQDILIGTFDRKVYLYALNSGNWSLAHEFDDPASDTTDGFGSLGDGSSVALSDDKETVAISAGTATFNSLTEAGAIYIYQSPADLALSMTANASLVALDQQVALDVTVTNNDTQVTAYNVVLTDTIPTGLTYMSASAAGGTCSASSATVTCTLASLAPGATWQPRLTVKVSTAGAYSNSASVTSNQPDADTTNNTASVSISMLPPKVSDGSVTTLEDLPANGVLTGSNPCNCGTPVFSVVAQPGHGSVSITNTTTGAFSYTPTAGYFGSDSFTFQLANGLNTSGTATESITINPLPPKVSGGSVTTDENTPVNDTLSGSNPCNCGTPVFSVVTQPSHGSVTITDTATGAFSYAPAMGYRGSDSFTFQLSNGTDTSSAATESVTITSTSASVGSSGGSSGGGGMDFLVLGLLSGLLTLIRRRRKWP